MASNEKGPSVQDRRAFGAAALAADGFMWGNSARGNAREGPGRAVAHLWEVRLSYESPPLTIWSLIFIANIRNSPCGIRLTLLWTGLHQNVRHSDSLRGRSGPEPLYGRTVRCMPSGPSDFHSEVLGSPRGWNSKISRPSSACSLRVTSSPPILNPFTTKWGEGSY